MYVSACTFLIQDRWEAGHFGVDYSVDEIIAPVSGNVQGSVTMLVLKIHFGTVSEKCIKED